MARSLLFALGFAVASTLPALGHEFWISPENYSVESDEALQAALRVGQGFTGASYAFIPQRFDRFDLVQGDQVVPVEGRVGDRPALNMVLPGPGMWVVVHETTDSILRYDDYETFVSFTEHKKLEGTLERHAERGLGEDVVETYRRFAKALVTSGDGVGADRAVGLRTEIVAEANPYTDDLSAGLPVQVLFEGAPRVGAQVEVFQRLGEDVTVTTQTTDDQGRAVIPVTPGAEYLLDAVKMVEVDPSVSDGAAWQSLWAALTFTVPAD